MTEKPKKKLAIIGASYLQMPLIETARRMGLETHVFAWQAGDPGEEAADFFYPVSIVETQEIEKICRNLEIDGICSIASDLAMKTVNQVAADLGLPANSLECTKLSTDKEQMRQAFAEHGDPSCRSVRIQSADDPALKELRMPLIIKPADRSGSRGISLVKREEELEAAFSQAKHESFDGHVLAEEFIPGKEYSVEYISSGGKHHFLALTEKETTGAPHFIETGHREPARVSPEILRKVRAVTEHALDSLQITTGASHTELKIDDEGRIGLIEIGGRMGGDLIGSHLVRFSTGVDMTELVIRCALGEPVSVPEQMAGRPVGVRFILSDSDLEEFRRLQEKEPWRILAAEDLHPEKIGTTTDSSNRAGCYVVDLS